jgi:PAS domain S-box-containing protein
MSTFVWVADASGEFASPQAGFEEYTGEGFEQHRGHGWLQSVHPEDRSRVSEAWARAVRSKSWYEVLSRVWHAPTGTWRRCLTHGVPILNSDGSVKEWIGAVTDVENRLAVEGGFPREWLRAAQVAGGLTFWEWNPITGEAHWSVELDQIFGTPPGSAQPALDRRIHAEDLPQVRAAREQAADSGHIDVTFRILRPSGEIRWLRSKGARVSQADRNRIVGVLIDITDTVRLQQRDRERAEELQSVIDAIPIPVWIARDPECKQMEGNRASYEMLGIEPGASAATSDWSGEPLYQNLGAEGLPLAPEEMPMQRVCRTGLALLNEQIHFRLRTGREFMMVANIVPLRDWKQRVRGCVAAFWSLKDLLTPASK